MAQAVIESPSHSISQTSEDGGCIRIRFRDAVFLDRDFVLRLAGLHAPASEVFIECGNDETFALATFYPQLPSEPTRHITTLPGRRQQQEMPATESAAGPSWEWSHPLRVKLLVDCSGSMQGDSIESARKGIRAFLDTLGSKDQIAVARFGNTLEHVLNPCCCEGKSLLSRGLRAIIRHLSPSPI